jgi:hypothetical protein
MPDADATQLIDAVVAQLEDLYPGVPVYKSKRQAANGRPPLGGWTEGYALPCFVVSEGDAEKIDEDGGFEEVSVRYPILVEYLKAAEAKVGVAQTKPSTVLEDPAIRDVRQAVRRRLYKPFLQGVSTAEIIDISETQKPVYETTTTGGGRAVVSGQTFAYLVWEPRAENS